VHNLRIESVASVLTMADKDVKDVKEKKSDETASDSESTKSLSYAAYTSSPTQRKRKLEQLNKRVLTLQTRHNKLKSEASEAKSELDEVNDERLTLQIIDEITNAANNAYLVEGGVLSKLEEMKPDLERMGLCLITDALKYGWEMNRVHGHSKWHKWSDDVPFDETGLFYQGKRLGGNIDIIDRYLDLKVNNGAEHYEDSIDTGKRVIAFFVKDEIGLVVCSKLWSSACARMKE
jgi:hypothetical protein